MIFKKNLLGVVEIFKNYYRLLGKVLQNPGFVISKTQRQGSVGSEELTFHL